MRFGVSYDAMLGEEITEPDESGHDNLLAIAYWDDPLRFKRWLDAPALTAWWQAPERATEGLGHFREVICPRIERYETLFSTPDRLEGIAVLSDGLSGEVQAPTLLVIQV